MEEADAGVDLVQSSINWTLGDNLENLTLTGDGILNGIGNALDNRLIGNGSDNTLEGKIGQDTLDGGAGADVLIGGRGNDTYIVGSVGDLVVENPNEGSDLVRSSVTWTLRPNIENLTLTGSRDINGTGSLANNRLTGNSGANTLQGGGGNDILIGGAGADRLTGGAGADQFKFTQPVEGGDAITDFRSSQGDQLVFTSENFGNIITGKLGSYRLVSNSTGTASHAVQRFIFNTRTSVLKYDPDGNGSARAVTIATLNGISSLSASQIQIVVS
ncbi:MAG: calcium-binding protein [Magnetococcales bacterium]|nr:calcium-binding protein [Magnetococcales bacterium]